MDVADELAAARTPSDVAAAATRACRRDIGGTGLVVYALEADGNTMSAIRNPEMDDLDPAFHTVTLDGAMPMASVGRDGRPRFHSPSQPCADVPGPVLEAMAAKGLTAFACLPLTIGGALAGGLSVSYSGLQAFAPEDELFLGAVARQVAVALDRARAFAEAERAKVWASVLAEATSGMLAASDAKGALQEAARACVPGLASVVAVYLMENGNPSFQFAVHADAEAEAVAQDVGRRFPVRDNLGAGPANVARTGQPELYAHVRHDNLASYARTPDELRVLEASSPGSVLIVPILQGERALGCFSFAHNQPGFYGANDLAHAQEFAVRAGLALQGAIQHRARIQLLSAVAHEVGNPLATTKIWVELFAQSQTHGTPLPAVDMLKRNVGRIARLIDDLRDAAGLQERRLDIRHEAIDLAAIVQATANDHAQPLRSAGLDLAVHVAGPIPVRGDRQRLEQVLDNLLSNARKFTPPPGTVTVKAAVIGNRAHVEVADSGAGMERGQLVRLFQPFTRTHEDMHRPGLGLGLYLSKGIVDLHGGQLWAQSPGPGKGTCFTFTIPIA